MLFMWPVCYNFILENVISHGFTNINHKIVMFDKEHVGNVVFWQVGFQKGNLSTSAGHLEVGLNDMRTSNTFKWSTTIDSPGFNFQ